MRHRRFFLLADDQHVRARSGGGRATAVGSLIATGSPSHASGGPDDFTLRDCSSIATSLRFLWMSAGALPSKTIAARLLRLCSSFARFCARDRDRLALLVRKPSHLERAVGFDKAALVVVDRLTRPGQATGRRNCCPRESIANRLRWSAARCAPPSGPMCCATGPRRSADGLRAQQHVNAERSALPHQAIEQHAEHPARACHLRKRIPGIRR